MNGIGNNYRRHIDGLDYMYALSEMIDSAQEVILILVSTIALSPISVYSKLFSGLVAYPGVVSPPSPCTFSGVET